MKRFFIQKISLGIMLVLLGNFYAETSSAQQTPAEPITRILFLLDASSSMMEPFGSQTRMGAAREILSRFVDSLQQKKNVELALRVYGHQSNSTLKDCIDTKLEVPFGAANTPYIRQVLNNISPKGVTPIAYSLQKAADDFPVDPTARNIVILLTDGSESCGGDPCAVSLELQRQHVILKPFIIGLGLDTAQLRTMSCMGTLYNAANPYELQSVLSETLKRILSSTSVQINLLDVNGKPLESDVNMTFYDQFSGVAEYNYYHTLNNRGEPDTVSVDPVNDYDLVIHTTPPITKEDLHFQQKQVNVVNVPAAQGYLNVVLKSATINNNLNSKIKCLVRRAGTYETVEVLDMNEVSKLLCGKYDLEILTLPRMQVSNVTVSQSSTTTIEVPQPGVLNITKPLQGYGSIFMYDKNRLVKIYQMKDNLTSELIGLQAGDYIVMFRPKLSNKTTDTKEKKITITSGQTAVLKF